MPPVQENYPDQAGRIRMPGIIAEISAAGIEPSSISACTDPVIRKIAIYLRAAVSAGEQQGIKLFQPLFDQSAPPLCNELKCGGQKIEESAPGSCCSSAERLPGEDGEGPQFRERDGFQIAEAVNRLPDAKNGLRQ